MKLSICMMVKDEENNLPRCLESLSALRKAIDNELIIVDTGSKDNTVEITKRYTDKIYFHPWNNNFSEMRNITIHYATGQWILIIDADEEIEDAQEIIDFLQSKDNDKYNGASVMVKNYTVLEGDMNSSSSMIISPRLFKNDGYFCYEGSIHNAPRFQGVFVDLKTVFLHYGYISTDSELMEKKFQRTSRLLKIELEKEPDNVYYRFQLSVTYKMHNDSKEALEEIRKAYATVTEKDLNPFQYLYVYQQLVICYLDANDFDSAERFCLEGVEHEAEFIDLYYWLAKLKGTKKDYNEAIQFYNKYLELCQNYETLPVRRNGALTFYTLEKIEEAYCDLAIVYHEMREFRKSLDYLEKVKQDSLMVKVTELIIELCFETGWYWELKDFFLECIYPRGEKEVEAFLIKSEQKYRKLQSKDQVLYAKEFALGNNQYAALNQVREAFYTNSEHTLTLINTMVKAVNFNKVADYYGDVLYFILALKAPIRDAFSNITEDNIFLLLNYVRFSFLDFETVLTQYREKSWGMPLASCVKHEEIHLNQAGVYDNASLDDVLGKARGQKIILRCLLMISSEQDKLGEIFEEYVSTGIQYLLCLYKIDVLKLENTCLLKNEEERLFLYLYLAQDALEHSNHLEYVRLLRMALHSYPSMSYGINLLLQKSQLQSKENNDIAQIEFDQYKKQVKLTIEALVTDGNLEKAKGIIKDYEELVQVDPEINSIKAVILQQEGDSDGAEAILHQGLEIDPLNFDLLYNLGTILECRGANEEAFIAYKKAKAVCSNDELVDIVEEALVRNGNYNGEPNQIECSKDDVELLKPHLDNTEQSTEIKLKRKLAFFVKQGLDSFLDDIIQGLSNDFETHKFIITDLTQIDSGMQWADICWFEWCDELIIYASKRVKPIGKKIICRIHGYEVYTNFIIETNWDNVDHLIVVTPHILRIFEQKVEVKRLNRTKINLVYCGVNIDKYPFQEKKTGFNLGYLGYINFKKNIPLTLDIFYSLFTKNHRYKLYLAGQFQDQRTLQYVQFFIKEHNLQNNIIFDGWQDYNQKIQWFKKINYMLISSIDEGLCYAAAESMASGIKPILHNCEGLKDHYSSQYLFNTVDEAVRMIQSSDYSSKTYRAYIEGKFSSTIETEKIKSIIYE